MCFEPSSLPPLKKLKNLRDNSLDICGHVLPSILNPNKQLTYEAFLVENKATPPFSFKQMPIPTVAIGDVMARFFGFIPMQKVTQLNVESCEIFGSLEQLHYVLSGVEFFGMFKSLGQLQGGVMG